MTTTTHEHPRRRRRFAALVGFALLTGSLGAGAISLAIFTDTDSVSGGAFSTGTIQIDATPTTVDFGPQPMLPGDVVKDTINVANVGTGAFRYAMTTAFDTGNATLASTLQLTVYEGATCGGTATVLYTGNLDSAFFGDPAQGDDGGDRDLAFAGSENLCFEVELPDTVSDPALQGVQTTVTFTFAAEQTANN